MNQSRSNAPASASLIALLWVLLPILAPASEETPIKDMPSRIAAIEALNAQIDRAVMSINKDDRTAALPLLKNIIESPAFEYLPPETTNSPHGTS
jgi:hypothetical protein